MYYTTNTMTPGIRTHTAINTFFNVDIKPKTLVMCDIDNTLIMWRKSRDQFAEQLYASYPGGMLAPFFQGLPLIRDMVNRSYSEYCANTPPIPTDYHGFKDLEHRVKQSGGHVVFVTARWKESDEHTRTQFRMLGFDTNYTIHYTNGSINKGEYIKRNINTGRYDHCVFIDDVQQVLDSVKNTLPHVQCYKFVADTLSV